MIKTNIFLLIFILCFFSVNIFAQETRSKPGHTGSVTSVVFSPDGKQIISGSYYDKTIRIWDVATGREIRSLFMRGNGISYVMLSPDGKQIISSSSALPGYIIIWDTNTGKELRSIWDFADRPIYSMDLSPDGKQIAAIYDESSDENSNVKIICFFDANTGKLIRYFFANGAGNIAFSPDGKRVVNSLSDIIIIWDPVTGQEILTISEDVRWANFIAFTPDGKYIISNVYSKQKTVPFINIYDANTGKKKTIISTKPELYSPIAISPDGNLIVFVPDNKKTIGLFDITADKEIKTISGFSGHTDNIKSLAFSPDGKIIVSGSADKSIKLWDVATGKEIRTMGE